MTHRDESDAPAPSRRSVLRATAGAGAAGLAATALGRAASGSGARSTRAATAQAAPPGDIPAEPVIVHVRDVTTGELDVFRGTAQARVRDRALALSIVRLSR